MSWNIHAIRGIDSPRLRGVLHAIASVEPDVLLLQEVGNQTELLQRLERGLRDAGLSALFYSGDSRVAQKHYGNLIAARTPLVAQQPPWAPGAPWHQLLARARLTIDNHSVDILSVHMPNGSGNGWKKIATFEALAASLHGAPHEPRLVGGDFNEPRSVVDNTIITFGAKKRADGSYVVGGNWTRRGETYPRSRWDAGVRSVLDAEQSHGLRHAFFARRGMRMETTHLSRGHPRFFDHLFVSKHFDVDDAGYRHDWREQRLSDHSAAWAKLRFA